jgi:hypothetical protein
VSAALVPSSSSTTIASAEIFSQPSGADVLINNAYKGITPLSLDNIPVDPTKTYSVEIRLTGYTPYTASGVIKPGQNVVINAALSPLVPPTTVTPLSLGTVLAALSLIGFLSVILKKKQ